jgi:transcriptional regulator with XRE-family HTH domain
MENTFGDCLKDIRLKRSIKAKDLATKLSVSESYISQVESGKTIPNFEMICKMFQTMELSLAETVKIMVASVDWSGFDLDYLQKYERTRFLALKYFIELVGKLSNRTIAVIYRALVQDQKKYKNQWERMDEKDRKKAEGVNDIDLSPDYE